MEFETATYYFLFLISLVLFIRQNYLCIGNYIDDKSTMSSDIVSANTAEFPAITICPEYDQAFKNVILKQNNLTNKDIRSLKFPKNGIKSLDFYEMITHNITKLVTELKISMVKPISGTNFTTVKLRDNMTNENPDRRILMKLLDEKDFIKQNYHTLGKCYTYEMPEMYKMSTVNNIELTMKMNGLIYLLHPGQFFWVDRDTKIPLNIKETHFIAANHQLTYSREKWSSDNKDFTCIEDMNRGIDNCLRNEFDKSFMDQFGCYYPMFSAQNETLKFCNISDLDIEQLKRFRALFHDNFYVRNNTPCSTPCAQMELFFGFPVIQPFGKASYNLKMYFKSNIIVKKSQVAYPTESFLAEMGGYLGLFLGFSMMDIHGLFKKIIEMMESFDGSVL